MSKFLRTFFPNFIGSFSGKFFVWHVAAIAATYVLVASGFDWRYFLLTRNPVLNIIFFPAIILGGLVGIFLPLILLAVAKRLNNARLALIAWTIGQAAILGWLISFIYKVFTGRIQPNLQNLSVNISDQFNFGFWRHGIFWGWPSSHTTVAFAMALALFVLLPQNRKIKYIALVYAFYVGVGVSLSIHWFSEFVAGAIIGSAIGIVVGRSFRKELL